MSLQVLAIEAALKPDLEEQRLQQGDIASRSQRQVDVRDLGGSRRAGIDDDHLDLIPGRSLASADALEQDRVTGLHVGADDQEGAGLLNVAVSRRRRVGPEREVVGGHGRRHAEPRVGVLVVRSDVALGQLAEEVVVLGHQLSRAVEHHAVRSMLVHRAPNRARRLVDRLVPRSAMQVCAFPFPDMRIEQATIQAEDVREQRPFGAELALIDRMVLVTAHGRDHAILCLHLDPAADAAVAADGSFPPFASEQR